MGILWNRQQDRPRIQQSDRESQRPAEYYRYNLISLVVVVVVVVIIIVIQVILSHCIIDFICQFVRSPDCLQASVDFSRQSSPSRCFHRRQPFDSLILAEIRLPGPPVVVVQLDGGDDDDEDDDYMCSLMAAAAKCSCVLFVK